MSDIDRPDIEPAPKPRMKKLRLLVILVPLSLLALVSTVFGMMMAVASDLPALENERQYNGPAPRPSILEDSQGRYIGRLASDQNRIYVRYEQISSYMRAAIISVEDQRFQTNSGVDLRGIARAFVQDLVNKGAVQGGSTITQQFVKNALQAQDRRTVFEKLREAAMAYHLTRKWGKKKILQEYLNSIYFGNGAYGIEAAAQTYFKSDPNHADCGRLVAPCARELAPAEAALLAGIVQSPTAYDPVAHPVAARHRRNVVLLKMYQQHYIDRATYEEQRQLALPAPEAVNPPSLSTKVPYFVSWVRQQIVDRFGAQRAFEGGLRIRTTIDLNLQKAAEQAVRSWLPGPNGPTAALVAIDNGSGEVRAMVSGTRNYKDAPFNLATQGQRQPGSSFKPFILAQALREGYGPGSVWPSRKREFCVTRKGKRCIEHFIVNNFENTYVGSRSLANALTWSDNSVFATVGIKVGTKKVAALAQRMGIRTPVSHNLAMTLGGLKEGVTPLDMAHAYETIETGGRRVTGTLGASRRGPVGIRFVRDQSGDIVARNKPVTKRILPAGVAQNAAQIMSTVVTTGTGRRAAIGEFAAGKTGTTENYGDAWFVGFTDRLTVAVWVGYPDRLVPMETDFQGGPVEGGTFPALIWHDFLTSANPILDSYRPDPEPGEDVAPEDTTTDPSAGTTEPGPDEGGDAPAEGGTRGDGDGGGGAQPKTPATPAPTPTPAPAAPTPAAPPAGGGTGEDGTGGAAPDTGGATPTG